MSTPFVLASLQQQENNELISEFRGQTNGFVQAGPQKYLFPTKYLKFANDIYNFEARSDDVWILSFPRSGTTVTQELLWMIANDLNYERANQSGLFERSLNIEQPIMASDDWTSYILGLCNGNPHEESKLHGFKRLTIPLLTTMDSPRVIKSHVPLSLLNPKLLDSCKVVYTARNPKDMSVSLYHIYRRYTNLGYNGDFTTFWQYFQRNLVIFCPYWEHLREAWEQREHPNMLFLFYEDLLKDMKSTIRKVAAHLNKNVSDEDVAKLEEYLHIDNMRRAFDERSDKSHIPGMCKPGEELFIRKGKNKGWVDYFTPELNASADQWIEENVKRIPGFQFPQI